VRFAHAAEPFLAGGPGESRPPAHYLKTQPKLADTDKVPLERFPATWHRFADKKTAQILMFVHVLIAKVPTLWRNMH